MISLIGSASLIVIGTGNVFSLIDNLFATGCDN